MNKRNFFFVISIITTIFFWLMMETYHLYHQVVPPTFTQNELRPLDPQIDSSVLKVIRR